ncbi:MAG: arginine--tRNA ligase [Pseudomonadales bacterium]|jgi:arginyl-tRNA synthetase|nr:arginine--tRNA ligase [Pseudomonadales bacterium]
MNLKQTLETAIAHALNQVSGRSGCQALVTPAKNPQFGDYQANGVMALAKQLGRNPRELGAAVLAEFQRDPLAAQLADKLELAGPGFINIVLKPEFLSAALNALHGERLVATTSAPEHVVIDYSGINLAKEMHVGHLRSTIIGDAIARTLDYLGYAPIRQNHFGDWGTQFGMLIAYMQELPQGNNLSADLADLESFYRAAKRRFDADPAFADLARANVVKLQAGDADCLLLWRRFIDISIAHCQALYDKLGITLNSAHVKPESFYNDRLKSVLDALKVQGLLTESDGAQCVFLDEFKNKEGDITPVIVQKTDGGYLYATTDLAAIAYRCQELHAKRVLYVVDARQSLHLAQVFAVARKAGFATPECQLEHLSFGTMMGKDGKPFKTRSGDTIKLVDLCNESCERAYTLVKEKNPDLSDEQHRQIATTVGIAAVKYSDLSKNRNSDYLFDWDTMLSFEGNTAPYLLYAYARIRSIFRRAECDVDARYAITVAQVEEKALALKLLQFTETVETLASDCLPNQLCLYLYELAGHFMKFYEACPVLKAQDSARESRLGLCQLTARTLQQGLALLGIETLEQM